MRDSLPLLNNSSENQYCHILGPNLRQKKPGTNHMDRRWSGDSFQHLLLLSDCLSMHTGSFLLDSIPRGQGEMCQCQCYHELDICSLSDIRMGRLDLGHPSYISCVGSRYVGLFLYNSMLSVSAPGDALGAESSTNKHEKSKIHHLRTSLQAPALKAPTVLES